MKTDDQTMQAAAGQAAGGFEPGAGLDRRRFLKGVILSTAGGMAVPGVAGAAESLAGGARADYDGPNVVIIRFGGGVRRRETIDPDHTFAPYFCKDLVKRGTLYKNMMIDTFQDINTSHGEGTLYILTGKYEKFADVGGKFLGARFESRVPTVFEYLRKSFNVPDHQTLIINGEDRTDEEFYSFSNHHLFGASFKSETLSLFRFKMFLLEKQLAEGRWSGSELEKHRKQLVEMKSKDYRTGIGRESSPEIREFWERWRAHYGESGLVNPRGDRLLTELTLRAMRHLRPKLVMVNYNDPDYVHWGNMSHYTRGVSIIDHGIRELVEAVESDDAYRDNTVFVIVPDCGRDSNPFVAVPCQHHFNSRSSHEIFALFMGRGIEKGVVVDKQVDQISVAATVGRLMGVETGFTEGPALEEVMA